MGYDSVTIGLAIAAYVAVQIGIGVWAGRSVKTDSDYYLAGRGLGLAAVSLSLFATWFGAETVMGSSAAINQEGLSGARAEPFGYAICLVAMAFLIAGAFRERGYVTLADFFRDRFDARSESAAALITVLVSIVWAAAQLLALAALLHAALDVPMNITLIAATVAVLIYTSFGGLKSDVVTDMVQGSILLLCLVFVMVGVAGLFGGIGPMLAKIEPSQLTLLGEGETWLDRIDAWAIPILGSLVTQEAISRLLAASTKQVAQRACLVAGGIYLSVGMIPVLIGLAGPHLALQGVDGDDFMPTLVRELLSPILYIAMSGALLSAILSTVDSNLLSVSSLVSVNLLGRLRANLSPNAKLRAARLTTIIAGLSAMVIAMSGQSIYDLIQLTSALGQAGILVAVLFGLWSRFGGPLAALAAIVSCILVNAYTMAIWPALQPKLDDGSAPEFSGGFLLSTVIAFLVYVAVAYWEKRNAAPPAPAA